MHIVSGCLALINDEVLLSICFVRIIIQAGIGRSVASVCVIFRALTEKWLELSTLNFVHVYSVAIARHARSQRSKGQGHTVRKPSRRTVANDHSSCPVTLCCASCGRCRRGSACRYDCQRFLVKHLSSL